MAEKDTGNNTPEPTEPIEPTVPTTPTEPTGALYTPEQLQKALDMERKKAFALGKAEKEKEYQKQQEEEAKAAAEAKRTSILDGIKADEKTAAWYKELDEKFEEKPLEWFETLELARTKNVEEFKEANTAPPVGNRTVGKSTSADSYWNKKDAEKRAKAKGGK